MCTHTHTRTTHLVDLQLVVHDPQTARLDLLGLQDILNVPQPLQQHGHGLQVRPRWCLLQSLQQHRLTLPLTQQVYVTGYAVPLTQQVYVTGYIVPLTQQVYVTGYIQYP